MESEVEKELAIRSIEYWNKLDNGKGLAGYSYTGASLLYSSMEDGENAYGYIHHFLNKPIGGALFLPNTLYVETGGKNPVIETPLNAGTAITEMLLQSWGGKIRIFPAVPHKWERAYFHNLRAIDGFTVSAQRDNSTTQWVEINSEAGKECVVSIKGWDNIYVIKGRKNTSIEKIGNNLFRIGVRQGESVVISYKRDTQAKPLFVKNTEPQNHYYGLKKGGHFSNEMVWPVITTDVENIPFQE